MKLLSSIRRRGSSVMEAALVFPILLSLTFGSVEFGHFFYIKHTMQGAAREGAREAIVPDTTNTKVTTAIRNAMIAAGFTDTGKYTIAIRNSTDTANVDVATAAPGVGILVRVSSSWGTVGVRPLGLISTTKAVAGQTVMRKEG